MSELIYPLAAEDISEVENVIIHCIDAGLIQAKLDQRLQRVEVFGCATRDIPVARLDEVLSRLQYWRVYFSNYVLLHSTLPSLSIKESPEHSIQFGAGK